MESENRSIKYIVSLVTWKPSELLSENPVTDNLAYYSLSVTLSGDYTIWVLFWDRIIKHFLSGFISNYRLNMGVLLCTHILCLLSCKLVSFPWSFALFAKFIFTIMHINSSLFKMFIHLKQSNCTAQINSFTERGQLSSILHYPLLPFFF